MIVTEDSFSETMEYLSQHPRLVADCETTGLRPWHDDHMFSIAIHAPGDDDAYYFPFRHRAGSSGNLPAGSAGKVAKMLSKRVITNWNTKFDLQFLMREGARLPHRAEDVMLAAHLMNENEKNFKLKELADKYLGVGSSQQEADLIALMESKGLDKGGMEHLTPEEVAPYAEADVLLTERLRDFYLPPLKEWSLDRLWQETNDYMVATTAMEAHGMLLDVPLIEKYIKEADRKVEPSRDKLRKLAGYDINPASWKQLQGWLEVPTTAKEYLELMLERMGEDSPAAEGIKALWDFRAWSKVNSTYYRPYLEKRDKNDCLHTNLSLTGTVTGRLSSFDPNMQAVARKTAIYKVKDVIIARPGYTLVSADYNQAELRLGSFFAKEEQLMKILLSGGDVHQSTADALGIPRDFAKRINFGAFYGLAAYSLSQKLHCSKEEASKFLEIYHDGFRAIRPFYRYMQAMANMNGYIRLWSGRVRRYNYTDAETQKALSNFVQGGVGEVMRTVITKMYRKYVEPRMIRMLLQVHDQVIYEVPEKEVMEWVPVVAKEMEFTQFKGMPMTVDVSYGKSWGNLTKWRKAA